MHCGLLLCVGLTGCASSTLFSSTNPPTLRVASVRVLERSADATLLALELSATNPNAEPMPLRDVQYHVRVGEGAPFAASRLAERTIPRFGTQTLTLPVVAPAGIDPASFTAAGSVIYLRPSVLSQTLLDIEFVTPTQGFAGTGSVGR